jgi:hypothetical protein
VTPRTPCDEIAADALALAALPPDAPERARAEEHARTCDACTRALAEGRRLLALVDGALGDLPAPSAAALARASGPVLAELDARAGAVAARAGARRMAAAVAAAVIAAWALPLALFRGPVVTGAPFALSLGLAAVAAIASAATVWWGGRVAAAFPLLSALSAFAVGTGRALDPAGGVHCALVEVAAAAGAGAAAWLATRALAKGPPRPEAVVAGVGGGALAGHAALHLACKGATELPHLLAFHTGPVALAVGLAALVASARRTRAVRESSRP